MAHDDAALNRGGDGGAWQLIFGFVAPLVTKAICELTVPDILAQSQTPLTPTEIVNRMPNIANGRTDLAADRLGRIMRYLAAQGVFTVHMPPGAPAQQPRYSLSAVSTLLLEGNSSKPSLRPLLLYQLCSPVLATLQHLAEFVIRGVPPCEAAHGMDLWELGKADPEVGRVFNSAMATASYITMDAFLAGYRGFDGFRGTLVDVGGGIGANVSSIVARYPSIIGAINFDQPHVVAGAPTYPRVEHVGGDMFQSVPQADIICLKWILHDWDDDHCVKILKNCHNALPKGGKIIIIESVLGYANEGFPNENLSLDMLMMAHTNGKERSEEEWEAILNASGFPQYKIIDIPCPQCVIEAYPNPE